MPFFIPLAIAATEFINSEIEKSKARKELDAIGDKGIHTVSPELQSAYNNAQELSKFGYTPEQKAAYNQSEAQSENTLYQRGIDKAPGLSQQLLSGFNALDLNAKNKFAANDADLQLKHIMYAAGLAKNIQSQKNLTTQDYIRQQEALGKGIAQQNQNEWSAINQAGYYGLKLGEKKDTGGGAIDPSTGLDAAGNRMMSNVKGYDLPPSDTSFDPNNPFSISKKYSKLIY